MGKSGGEKGAGQADRVEREVPAYNLASSRAVPKNFYPPVKNLTA